MKNILFLDLDGVMVLGSSYSTGPHESSPFDKGCVKILNGIIDETDCEIVLSSTWKHFYDLDKIKEIFAWNNVQKTPSEFTPNYEDKPGEYEEPDTIKCQEIKEWLAKKDPSNKKYRWCAVDDWNLSFGLENFIHCHDHKAGIKSKGVAKKILVHFTKSKK